VLVNLNVACGAASFLQPQAIGCEAVPGGARLRRPALAIPFTMLAATFFELRF
jgi:hypothetical protein